MHGIHYFSKINIGIIKAIQFKRHCFKRLHQYLSDGDCTYIIFILVLLFRNAKYLPMRIILCIYYFLNVPVLLMFVVGFYLLTPVLIINFAL